MINDRFSNPLDSNSSDVTIEQQSIIDKIQVGIIKLSSQDKQKEADTLAAILEYLPDHPVLAIMVAEMVDLPQKYVKQLRKAFNIERPFF